MKKKLFTLLTLLLTLCSGAWGDPTYKSSFTDFTAIGGSSDKYMWLSKDNVDAASSWIVVNEATSGEIAESNTINPATESALSASTKHTYYRPKNNTKYLTIYLTNVTQVKFYAYNSSSSKPLYASINGGTLTKIGEKTGSGGPFICTISNLNASTNYAITIHGNGTEVYVTGIRVTPAASGKTALTGAWNPTSVSVAKGASAPSNPAFAMSAGTAGAEGDYTITYSEVSDENNIVTTNASTGITGISTTNAGTATIRATVALTETGAASYTLATTTYDITVTVSNIATLFSMTNITGPTTALAAGGTADVTATFSDGGSAEVRNAHSSNSSVMVTSNTIYLTSSGNSYCHVSFPTKLQAGDVISLGETTGTAYISKTTDKGSTTYTIPYTIPAESGFIGATDIYIFNNKDKGDVKVASFNTFTIQGAAAASDLTITSEKNITLATNATSNITYTSSNTTGAVTYATSASSVAEVSSAGVITAKAPGTATITITQASDGTIREAAAKVIVTVERARKATEVTGEFVLDTNNGTQSSGSYISTDESVYLEGGIDNGNNTYDDLKNSHFKHSSNITFTLPTNYPVSTVWFVGYRNNSSNTATIKLKQVDGASVTEQSGTLGGSTARPAADCVGFALETPAEESMVINISNQCRGYFILNPAAQNITLTQVGSNYYASYYSVGETTITGATAYTATLDAENNKVVLTECANGVVGGRTGVILIGNSASATATPSFTGAEKGQGDLIGAGQKQVAMANYYASGTSAADKVFVLGVENGKAGLYKYTGTSLGVNKAYLYNETLISARALTFGFDNETTAINGVSVETVKNELKKYFENGQIVIEKDGMKYNAAGQQIK